MSGVGPDWDEFKRAFKQARAEENSQWERTERDRGEENSRWEVNKQARADENSRWEGNKQARAEEISRWGCTEQDHAGGNSRWESTERDRRQEDFRWERTEQDRGEEKSRKGRAERLAKSTADILRPVATGKVSTALGDALTQKRVEVFSARSGFERSNWNRTLSKEPERAKVIGRSRGIDLSRGYGD
jgi:hypothetical protein